MLKSPRESGIQQKLDGHSIGSGFSPADRLRRIVQAAPTLGPDGEWLSERLDAYLAARGATTLDEALGLVAGAGRAPWWAAERLARRDAALRELALLMPAATIAEIATMLARYETTAWCRDSALLAAPADYSATPRGAMFAAFRAGDGSVPTSAKQLRRILSQGHENRSFDVPRSPQNCETTKKEQPA